MSLKKLYYFVFYKLYKFFETSPIRYWSEWKASLMMDIIVGGIITAGGIDYTIITKKGFIVFESNTLTWAMIIFIPLCNYLIFNNTDRWRLIITDFDKWPKLKNRVGGIIVWSAIILIFTTNIFLFYLMSEIDWKQYK